MKAHEIQMVGKFLLKNEASPLTWTAADEGRLVYASNKILYYGNNANYQRIALGDESTFALKAAENNFTSRQLPNADNTYALGDNSKRWSYVYAVSFQGTVTTATYADLAEMYKTAVKYPVGTVVKISENPEYDICMADEKDENILGVISSKPGFILNFVDKKVENMQPVGLVGRVPVRIVGAIKKGQPIMSCLGGKACAYDGKNPETKFGVSLETSIEEGEKLVECSIK